MRETKENIMGITSAETARRTRNNNKSRESSIVVTQTILRSMARTADAETIQNNIERQRNLRS